MTNQIDIYLYTNTHAHTRRERLTFILYNRAFIARHVMKNAEPKSREDEKKEKRDYS